jgi:myo-inositol 2-dehydrogenase/D-chiro-inositol 1-dehydrogenase
MKFGLIGFGAWGQHHAKAISQAPGGQLVAIATSSKETADAARKAYPHAQIYQDYRQLLANPDVETADIVVPNHLHGEIGVAALDAGKHVLLEKPMAISRQQCDALIAARDRNRRLLTIAHDYRTSRQYVHIKELIEAGDLGEPTYVNINLFRNPFRHGAQGWRFSRERVGSWILEEPVHFFDLVLWYMEPHGDPVTIVAASSSSDPERGLHDNLSCIMRYNSGAFGVISQSLAGFQHHTQVQVVGTAGAARTVWSGQLDRDPMPKVSLDVRTRHLAFERGVHECEPVALSADSEGFKLQSQINRVINAFERGEEPTPGKEARKRVIVCLAAEQSLQEGREVAIAF